MRRSRKGRGKGQLGHLPGSHIHQLGASMAKVNIPHPAKAVDVGISINVGDRGTMTRGPDERMCLVIRVMLRMNQQVLVGSFKFGSVERLPG